MTEDSKAVEVVARAVFNEQQRRVSEYSRVPLGTWDDAEPEAQEEGRRDAEAAIAAHLAHLEAEGMVVVSLEDATRGICLDCGHQQSDGVCRPDICRDPAGWPD